MLSIKIIVSTIFKKRLFTKGLLSRISAIILLFAAIIIPGIGIYSGLFNISFSPTLIKYVFVIVSTSILMSYIYNIRGLSSIRNINFYEVLITFIIIFSLIIFIISLIKDISEYNINLINNMNPNTSQNNFPQDPVRYWPSGISFTWGIIGSALLVYRGTPGSHRIKSIAAFTSLGVSIPATMYSMAVENPYGFNNFMFGCTEYKRTGIWPSNINKNNLSNSQNQSLSNDEVVTNFEKSSQTSINDYSKKFIDDNNWFEELINSSIKNFFESIYNFIKPMPVEGYFDDLYNFIWFSQILLLIMCISLLILFTIYIFINIFLMNKESISKNFPNNKLIKFYFKYQIILGYISFYLLPLFIFFGLIQMIYILYHSITHPLPIEELPIDNIHIYLSSIKKR